MNPKNEVLDIASRVMAELVVKSSKKVEVERDNIAVKGYWVGDMLRIDIKGIRKRE